MVDRLLLVRFWARIGAEFEFEERCEAHGGFALGLAVTEL